LLPSTAASDFTGYQEDPVPFVRTALHGDPWDEQQRIMRATATRRRVAVRSCHNSGKTYTAACLVHWFLRAFDPSLVITTAPTLRQVEKQLWGEIATLHHKSGLPGKLLATSLEVSPNQRAYGFTTNVTDKFQGWHCDNLLVIVDEASGVEEPIYEAIEGCLTGPNPHLLLLGNPNYPAGTFYEAFKNGLFERFHIAAADVPEHLLPRQWAEERRIAWGEDSPVYQVRVMGNFPDEGEDSLFSLRDIEAAQERDIDATDAACEVGVDVARYGGDESVAYVRRGGRVIGADYWRGADIPGSAGRVAALCRRVGGTLVKVDDIGVGGGVTDLLSAEFKDKGVTVQGVNVGVAAWDSENYANRRAEIYAGLAQRFKEGDIVIPKDDSLLVDQLMAHRKTFTARGQMKLPSKEDFYKNRSSSLAWKSPDRADALALCFAGGRREFLWESW
jgi:hypothetical protein